MGICQKKCNCGFSKSSKFKRVVLLVLMTFCVELDGQSHRKWDIDTILL